MAFLGRKRIDRTVKGTHGKHKVVALIGYLVEMTAWRVIPSNGVGVMRCYMEIRIHC